MTIKDFLTTNPNIFNLIMSDYKENMKYENVGDVRIFEVIEWYLKSIWITEFYSYEILHGNFDLTLKKMVMENINHLFLKIRQNIIISEAIYNSANDLFISNDSANENSNSYTAFNTDGTYSKNISTTRTREDNKLAFLFSFDKDFKNIFDPLNKIILQYLQVLYEI